MRRAFLFQPGDTAKYLAPEKLSPELLALGEHVAQGNPLRRKAFLDEDKCWMHMSSLTRSSMRLAAYAGALTNLVVQADDLRVSQEDRALLSSLLVETVHSSGLLYKAPPPGPGLVGPRFLGAAALSADPRHALRGPILVLRAIHPENQRGARHRQQARELAGQLPQSQAPRPRSFGHPRAQPGSQVAPPRVTVTLPAPQPDRGSHSGRGCGRSHRGETPRAAWSSPGHCTGVSTAPCLGRLVRTLFLR